MKNFAKLVNETVDSGYSRGIALFTENLEHEIQKNLFIENEGIQAVVSALFEEDKKTEEKKDDLVDID